jgi:hypothetical protein
VSFFETYRFLGDIASPFSPFLRPPPQFPGDDYLRDLQKDQIPIFHVLPVFLKNMIVLVRGFHLIPKGEVKSVVDFKEGKVLEIFRYALNRQGFFIKGIFSDFMAPAGNLIFISPLRLNLPDPPGIPVAGRSNQDVWVDISN